MLTNDTDVDAGDTKTVSAITGGTVGSALVGTYGTLTLNANGTYTYVVNNANATVQALRTAAQTVTETFTYTMADTAGATSSSTLVITIQGANDAPVASGAIAGTVTDTAAADTFTSLTGTFTATDVDAGDTKTWSVNGGTVRVGTYGTLTINASTGAYTYVVNAAAVNALPAGSNPTDVFTATVTDAAGATATQVLTVTVNGANDAPIGTTDSYTAVEGATVVRGSVLGNDTDAESSPLTALQVATNSGATAIPVNGTNAITTALGGTVVMNTDGTFTYTAPARLHNDAISDVDSFVYKASDGTTTSAWTTVNITITDTAPVANPDTDDVGRNSTTTGNVITGTGGATADTLGADSATVSAVSIAGSISNTKVGTTWTVVTNTGTLTISENGAYSYASNAPNLVVTAPTSVAGWTSAGVGVFGFDGTEPYTTGTTATSGLNLTSLTAAREAFVRYRDLAGTNNDGIGVEATAGTNNNNRIEGGEELVLNINRLSKSTTVTLTDLANGETAYWHAYSATGTWVASGTIAGNGTNIATGTISAGTAFQYIVLTSVGSNFRLNGLDAIPEVAPVTFNYTLTDADGSSSSSTLTISTTSQATAIADTAQVYESALAGGTDPGVLAVTATGNLLDNDSGVTATTSITSVTGGTGPDGNGVITVNDSVGTLTVYTQNYNGNLAGAYSYTLTGGTTDGSSDARSFTYTLTDSATGQTSSAALTVNVIDDAPLAFNATAEVAESSSPSYNLVLMLDISASMYINDGGGEVRAIAADGTVTITTRLAMAKAGMVALVEEYFAQSPSVVVKVGLFANGSLMLNSGNAYTDKAALVAAINGITGTELVSATYYEDGINAMQAAFGTPSSSVTNISYFLSDGSPTDPGAANTAIANYTAFASANNIKSYAVGIGTGIADPSYLNNLHIVDADLSGAGDTAIIVPDLNSLDEALLSTVPSAYSGSVAGTGGASNVSFGADGGYISYVDLVIDTDAAGAGTATQTVRFSYNPGTDQITQNSSLGFLTSAFPLSGSVLTVNASKGFMDGTLTFDFTNGQYTYFTSGQAVEGDSFTIGFQVTDGDGDTANAVQTILVVDGKPVARDDYDTLMPKDTRFEGNVINGIGTDGGAIEIFTEFSSSAVSKDTILDGATVSSITFKGVAFNLTANSSGTAAGGTYTVTNGKLTWTSSTEAANVLVFNKDGYYQYTPPAAQTAAPAQSAAVTTNFTSSANADDNGITLTGFTRTANLTGAASYDHAALNYNTTGVGVPAGETAGTVDDLETLVIRFNAADHPYGVQNVSITINAANSNLSSSTTVGGYGGVVTSVTYRVYDISGNMVGLFSSFAEGPIAIPSQYSNIGRIEIESGSAARARVQSVAFNSITGGGTATAYAPEEIAYTLTDTDGDSSTATLHLHTITNHYAGTAAGDTITGSAANDYISGGAGNDVLNGGAGHDLIRGDAGNDTIDGGAGDDRLFGGTGNDIISGGIGNDELYGEAGDDILNGNDGNDLIYGGAGNDTINGGLGDDIIFGGAGNDTMTGGGGADIFKWELADTGIKGSPAVDTITDFDNVAATSGGDVLDLRDLLLGENHDVGIGNLANYLHFEKAGANTVVHVSSTGEFATGYTAAKEVQTVVLQNVDLIGSMNTDQQIIQDLLTRGKLNTD
ncbi:MAG: VCBS domain-containing protein [Acidovorax sp.]|nr:VCBS domain-containing protein [Acidovorax sp.]